MGEQVLNRKRRGTAGYKTFTYRFLTHYSELDILGRDSEHSEESIFVFFRVVCHSEIVR